MGPAHAQPQLGKLWQLPLLVVSLALFVYAGYVFIAPKPPPSITQRLQVARELLRLERADAAIGQLNDILADSSIKPAQEGAARVLLGEGLELAQKQRRISIAENYAQIIKQTELGLAAGIEADARVHQRLAESYEALGRAQEAITHYRKAMNLDKDRSLLWLRRVIALQLDHQDAEGAGQSLEEYLKSPGLADSERAWAMGEKAHALIDRGLFKDARDMLGEALKLRIGQSSEQGRFNYWLGYCAWKLKDLPEAERRLRVARDLLHIQHPLDADAAYYLGRIKQEQKDWPVANSFFAAVLQSHLDKPVAILARLGRGLCRIALGSEDGGLMDLHDVVRTVKEKESLPARYREETVAGLQQGQQLLSASGNYHGALELMVYEQELTPRPPGEFFARLGRLYEQRAYQLDQASGDKGQREEKVRELHAKAGDAYIAYSRAMTLSSDQDYGTALWKGIEQYELAGDVSRVIAALEMFISERPDDPQAPEALLRLGQSYHVAGFFDKAIAVYHKCRDPRYDKSLAAAKSRVPLARAYIAKGPDSYPDAERVLRSVIENNPQITPEAREFRDALLELAQLYYRTARYELAIGRLEELTQRYPNDENMGRLLFLMGDSYRKSASVLDDRIKSALATPTTRPTFDVQEAARAKQDRLTRAKDLYQRVMDCYRQRRPATDLDKLYLKLAHFYKADCVYDLGDYIEAISLYGDAAFRYQDDAAALAAYVQIVNANVHLGRIEEAKAANERAKWMLRRMPTDSFDGGGAYAMPRAAWEQWLRWTGEAGVWK